MKHTLPTWPRSGAGDTDLVLVWPDYLTEIGACQIDWDLLSQFEGLAVTAPTIKRANNDTADKCMDRPTQLYVYMYIYMYVFIFSPGSCLCQECERFGSPFLSQLGTLFVLFGLGTAHLQNDSLESGKCHILVSGMYTNKQRVSEACDRARSYCCSSGKEAWYCCVNSST